MGYIRFIDPSYGMPLIFKDNQASIKLANNSLIAKDSKHIQIRFHTVKDYDRDLCYCPTTENLANPLTKPLSQDKYISLFIIQMGIDWVASR